jgi:hypothetical protein
MKGPKPGDILFAFHSTVWSGVSESFSGHIVYPEDCYVITTCKWGEPVVVLDSSYSAQSHEREELLLIDIKVLTSKSNIGWIHAACSTDGKPSKMDKVIKIKDLSKWDEHAKNPNVDKRMAEIYKENMKEEEWNASDIG